MGVAEWLDPRKTGPNRQCRRRRRPGAGRRRKIPGMDVGGHQTLRRRICPAGRRHGRAAIAGRPNRRCPHNRKKRNRPRAPAQDWTW